VTGISDTIVGRETRSEQTATEAQLITSAANVRIQNKTWRVEQELARPACQQFIALNQQHITERSLRVQAEPEPGDVEADQRWAWEELTAEQLSGEMMVIPVGGASAPDNVPQDRADARDLFTSFAQDPMVDPVKLRTRVLEKLGIKQAETWVQPPPGPPIPPEALDFLVEAAGVDPAAIEAALEATQAQAVAYAELPPEEQPRPVVGGHDAGQGFTPPDLQPEADQGGEEETEADQALKLAQAEKAAAEAQRALAEAELARVKPELERMKLEAQERQAQEAAKARAQAAKQRPAPASANGR